jgi:hypothetical protein
VTVLRWHVGPAGVVAACCLLAAAALVVLVVRIRRAAKRSGGLTVLGRLLAGIDLEHGRDHWTNAGWFTRPGEVVLTRAGSIRKRASWWQHQNYAFRFLARCGWAAVLAAYLAGRSQAGPYAGPYAGAGAAAAAAGGLAVLAVYVRVMARPRWLSMDWVPRPRAHQVQRVAALGEALSDVAKMSPKAVTKGLTWHPDYANTAPGDEVLRWRLPPGLKGTPAERTVVEDLMTARVGFDLMARWVTSDLPPELIMTRARALPDKAWLHELLGRLDALPEHETGLGLDDSDGVGDHDGLVRWDWSCENPHGVMNAGSRHGKTELNKCMLAQIIRKGGMRPDCPALADGQTWCPCAGCGGVTYIDPKEISLYGLEGLPGLHLLNDPSDIPAMWEGIAAFRHVMDARREERAAGTATNWPRRVLFLEEANQFGEMSDDFWEELPEGDRSRLGTELWKPRRAKKTPRFWRHVKAIAWQGAAFNMHVFVDGQDLYASVLKGIRNSLQYRILGAFVPQQWDTLVGTKPRPLAPTHKGRFILVNGGTQTWMQAIVADLDPDRSSAIWRAYALNGRPDPGRPPTPAPVTGTPMTTANGQASPGNGNALSPVTGDLAVPMTLLDIARIFLAPAAPEADQRRRAWALKSDRARSDEAREEGRTLPGGLLFPDSVGLCGQAQLFLPHQVIAFDTARRGTTRRQMT